MDDEALHNLPRVHLRAKLGAKDRELAKEFFIIYLRAMKRSFQDGRSSMQNDLKTLLGITHTANEHE